MTGLNIYSPEKLHINNLDRRLPSWHPAKGQVRIPNMPSRAKTVRIVGLNAKGVCVEESMARIVFVTTWSFHPRKVFIESKINDGSGLDNIINKSKGSNRVTTDNSNDQLENVLICTILLLSSVRLEMPNKS